MILKIAWRNIYRNKKRSLITITSIFAALFLIILMRALQFGFYDKLIETVVESYAGYVEVHADGFWDNQNLDNSMEVDQNLINNIKSVEGVDNIVQRLQTFSLISMGNKTKGGVINGVNISDEQKITDGSKKMSKSDPSDLSRINLNDSKDEIINKIKKAKTDTQPLPDDEKNLRERPEAENLLGIYSSLNNQSFKKP